MTRSPDSHEYFRLLAAASIDGEVTPSEMIELRAHLATCPACRADDRAMRADNAWLASVEAVRSPRQEVRSAVLRAADGRAARGLGRGFGSVAATFATIAVAVGAAWWLSFGRVPLSPGASSPASSAPSQRPSAFQATAPAPFCSGNPFAPAADIPTTSAGNAPWAMAAADMDGDAVLDLVIFNKEPGAIGVLLGDGRGAFGQPRPVAAIDPNPLAGSGEPTLLAADITNDGMADVIAANPELGLVIVYIGDGSGGLGEPTSVGVGGEPGHIAVGQFGGDTNMDFAVADESGSVLILIGAGTGTFEPLPRIELGGSPRGIAAGDLDGDGRADLVVGHDGDHRVEVMLGSGDGTFGPSLVLEGLAATHVNLVDVDTDGDLDALLSNSGPDSVSVMLGDGAGSFGSALVLPLTNGAPGSTEAIDVDGDGDLDIVVNDAVSSDLAIFLGDGRGGFEILERRAASGGPTGLVAGDFDRDGRPDVATSNANGNSVSVLLGRCGATPG